MYKCILDIRVFSRDQELIDAIRYAEPLESFEHNISVLQDFSVTCADGDVIIIDNSAQPDLSALRRACKPEAVLVLCADEAVRAALTPGEYAVLDEFWPRPLSLAYLAFAFDKVLQRIKLKKDYQLTQVYLDTTINSIPDLVWYKDVRGSHIKVNDSFCRAVGKTKKAVEGRGHYYIWDIEPEEYAQGEYVCLETEEIVLRERKTCLFDEKVKSRLGMRQFKTYKSPLLFDDGQLMGTVGIAQDVTDLANRGAELEIFLRNMPFALLISDTEDTIISVNDKFEEYFATTQKAVEGQSYTAWKRALKGRKESGSVSGYTEVLLPQGQGQGQDCRIVELHEVPILDVFQNRVGQFCICRDMTAERTLEQQMLKSANTDPLTGLYNRRYLFDYIEKNRKDGAISLLYVDLDNFKQVNDTYGHKAGDETLIFVADLISRHFPDDLAVRIGGDEFVVCVLGAFQPSHLEERATLLLDAMRANFLSTSHLLKVSASIGIAWTDDPHMDIEELIRHSDTAMYRAKDRGKSCYYLHTADRSGATDGARAPARG